MVDVRSTPRSPSTRDSRIDRRRVERLTTDVDAFILEHVVGHEHDGNRADHLRDLLLSADSLLQCGKGQRPFVAEGEHLAVEHGAVGQPGGRGRNLGKPVRDELFAARPEMDGASPAHELRANAVPFPFDDPVVDGAKRLDRLLERRREEERIGPRPVVVGVLVREEGREPRRAWRPLAHQARRNRGRRQPGSLRQRADDERLRDADAQFAGEDLEEHEPLQAIEPRPPAADECLLGGRIEFAKRKNPVLHPGGQRRIVGGRDRHLIEHERRRLGAVTDDRIALVQQPFVEAGGRECPRPDCGRRNEPFEATAGQEEHRPRRVRLRAPSENTATMAATLALVEVVRSMASYSAAKRFMASIAGGFAFPGRAHDARLQPALAQITRERIGVAMGCEHTRRAGVCDCLQQRRPVGVIGKSEAAVEPALPPDAAHPHQAGRECVGDVTEAADPRRAARRQWRQHELAGEGRGGGARSARAFDHREHRQHGDACFAVDLDHPQHHPVHVHGPVRHPHELGQQSLRLAERVTEQQGGPVVLGIRLPPARQCRR